MARFLSPYELDEISGILSDRITPLPTELQENFGAVQLFETETIDMDQIADDLRIGIFVAPDINAKPTVGRGYDTKVFYPGYWKDKATVDFRNIRKRRIGQALSAPTSNAGKIALAIQDKMDIMKAKRARLLEWIAAEILITGQYTAVSERHPSVLVDLERNVVTTAAGLNGGRANQADLVTINDNGGVGKRAWNAVAPTKANSPVADLQQMLDAAWEPIAKIYISDDAWALLVKDPDIDTFLSKDITTITSFNVDLLPKQQTKEGLKLRGLIGAAQIPLYTYNAQYQATTDASTTLTKFLPNGYVIMVPSSVFGVQAYGAIQHGGADFRASELFWNSWMTDEDGKPWLQGQAAPIFLHTKINSTVCWKVIDPAP